MYLEIPHWESHSNLKKKICEHSFQQKNQLPGKALPLADLSWKQRMDTTYLKMCEVPALTSTEPNFGNDSMGIVLSNIFMTQ